MSWTCNLCLGELISDSDKSTSHAEEQIEIAFKI